MRILPPPRVGLTVFTVTIILCVILLATLRLRPGIDFTGGSLMEVEGTADNAPSVRAAVEEQLHGEVTVQPTRDRSLIIRLPQIDAAAHQKLLSSLQEKKIVGQELRYEVIGPTIGAELRRKAWTAVSLATIALILYLTYTFRSLRGFVSSWKFGVATVMATLHDILVVAACFTLLGRYFDATVDTLFVTALLAVLGYSVNDTIILFMRFLYEWRRARKERFMDVMDRAARATLVRSFNTSLTILIVLLVLLVFGGTTIRWFIVALTLGTVVGTYSSIYIAPYLLYYLARPRS